MTKKQEIEELKGFIAHLKERGVGYIAPWLEASLPSIVNALTSDIDPSIYTMSLPDYHKHLKDKLSTTNQQCEEMLAEAGMKSSMMKEGASNIINQAAEALKLSLRTLQDHY